MVISYYIAVAREKDFAFFVSWCKKYVFGTEINDCIAFFDSACISEMLLHKR